MSVEQTIVEKLTAAFSPTALTVINESHLHRGHAGSPGTGDSHFKVEIVSAAFAGDSRVTAQRRVMQALKAELDGPVHALSIKASAG